jgi:hypothetical protein
VCNDFQKGLERVKNFLHDMLEDNDPWNNRIDVSLVRLLLSDFAETLSEDEKGGAKANHRYLTRWLNYMARIKTQLPRTGELGRDLSMSRRYFIPRAALH